jgi:hypothetical protein
MLQARDQRKRCRIFEISCLQSHKIQFHFSLYHTVVLNVTNLHLLYKHISVKHTFPTTASAEVNKCSDEKRGGGKKAHRKNGYNNEQLYNITNCFNTKN